MGFTHNAARRAVIAVGADVDDSVQPELPVEWMFAHLEDPDINDPISVSAGYRNGDGNEDGCDGFDAETKFKDGVNPVLLNQLMALGFPEGPCTHALKRVGGDPDRAVEILFHETS